MGEMMLNTNERRDDSCVFVHLKVLVLLSDLTFSVVT